MKKYVKVIYAVLAAVCLSMCLALFACGSSDRTDTPDLSDAPDTTAPALNMENATGNAYAVTVEPDAKAFVLPVVTATDAHDGNVTSFIKVACDKGDEYINVEKNKNGAVVSLNRATVGVYVITYSVDDMADNAAAPLVATVTVADGIAPVLTMSNVEGEYTRTVFTVETHELPVVTALDAYDGNVTESIEVTCDKGNQCIDVTKSADGVGVLFKKNDEGEYKITYTVSDAAGNVKNLVATITVGADKTAPVLTMEETSQPQEFRVRYGGNVVLPAVSASDDHDGDITDKINVACTGEGTVNKEQTADGMVATFSASRTGTYTVTYSVQDESGNAATEITQTITVYDDVAPQITKKNAQEKSKPLYIATTGGGTFNLPVMIATDEHDGNISANINVTCDKDNENVSVNKTADGVAVSVTSAVDETYAFTYTVLDATGNAAAEYVTKVEFTSAAREIKIEELNQSDSTLITPVNADGVLAEYVNAPEAVSGLAGFGEKVWHLKVKFKRDEPLMLPLDGTEGKFISGHIYRIEFYYYNTQQLTEKKAKNGQSGFAKNKINVGLMGNDSSEPYRNIRTPGSGAGEHYCKAGGNDATTGYHFFTATENDKQACFIFSEPDPAWTVHEDAAQELWIGNFRILDLTYVETSPNESEENVKVWDNVNNVLLVQYASVSEKPDCIKNLTDETDPNNYREHFGEYVQYLRDDRQNKRAYSFPVQGMFEQGKTYKIEFWYYMETSVPQNGKIECSLNGGETKFEDFPKDTGIGHFEVTFTATAADSEGVFYLKPLDESGEGVLMSMYIGEFRIAELVSPETPQSI